jgi:hypothetical protein
VLLQNYSAAPSRDAPVSLSDGAIYFAIGIGLDLLLGLGNLRAVLAGSLATPDSYMRLVRLREIVALGAPIHVVARDGSGNGTVIAWTHLLDAVILLLASPLRLFLGAPDALFYAAAATGPIALGLLGLALAWSTAPLADRGWRWTAPLLAATVVAVSAYGAPGVVHHHIPVAFAVTMALGWALRADTNRRAGWGMGLWGAIAVTLTPEAMPFLLAGFGGVGLAWLTRPEARGPAATLRQAGTGFLLLIAAAFALDPPYAGYGAIEIDRLSIVYLALGVVLAAIGWAVAAIDRRRLSPLPRALLGGGVALLGLALWLALFPRVMLGPDGLMSAAAARAFFGPMAEMQPVRGLAVAWTLLLDGVLALAFAVTMALVRRSLLWVYLALGAAAMLLLGAQHVRFLTYTAALSAALLPVALTQCEAALRRAADPIRTFAPVALLALFIIGPYAGTLMTAGAADAPAPACAVGGLAPLLAPYAGQVVLADVDATPELLYRTGILTVGSFYHRNIAGYMRLYAAWRSPPSDTLPEAVRATRARLVLVCPHAPRTGLVADLPEDTLWDRLGRGEVPRWLEEIAADPASGHVLYRVIE